MCEHAFKSGSCCHLILTDGAGSLHLYIIVELISMDLAGAWITIFIGVKVAGQLSVFLLTMSLEQDQILYHHWDRERCPPHRSPYRP